MRKGNIIGKRIRFVRELRRWTQQQFARKLRHAGHEVSRDIVRAGNSVNRRSPTRTCLASPLSCGFPSWISFQPENGEGLGKFDPPDFIHEQG